CLVVDCIDAHIHSTSARLHQSQSQGGHIPCGDRSCCEHSLLSGCTDCLNHLRSIGLPGMGEQGASCLTFPKLELSGFQLSSLQSNNPREFLLLHAAVPSFFGRWFSAALG